MVWLVAMAVLFLAFSNGSNDNFKGVATIYGSGTASYGRALGWATLTTLAGSLLSLVVAPGLLRAFSGQGLVPAATAGSPAFLAAVALGASLTVVAATRWGFPVSTTHAMTGALVGAGLVAVGRGVNVTVLGRSIVLPLLLSPLVAIVLAAALYPLARAARRALGIERTTCACVGTEWVPVTSLVAARGATVVAGAPRVVLATGTSADCAERYQGALVGVSAQRVLDALHFVSAGAMSFARGVNDTPKVMALLVAVRLVGGWTSAAGVALAMAVGGILGARRVAETISHRITSLNPGQGFVANAETALLVIAASLWKLPVSTTHVSTGAIFGTGLVNGTARWRTLSVILAAWVTTLPAAAVAGASLYALFARV